eukprot:TRINITY_DN12587_c0_g1_i1.p1 TRINITY_DN12587_c0_g1~~TRINITY_DN12587_c0_g1_i1.p1  ORF type:complete len:107 (+),score=25.35 TRINITY_DN12587_c0_g1_i1:135-455(+)
MTKTAWIEDVTLPPIPPTNAWDKDKVIEEESPSVADRPSDLQRFSRLPSMPAPVPVVKEERVSEMAEEVEEEETRCCGWFWRLFRRSRPKKYAYGGDRSVPLINED